MPVRKRLLVIVGVPVLVAAVLATAGALWWRWDGSRQPQVTADIPVLDRTVADLVTATGDGAAVAVSGVFRSAACRLGPLREGGRFTRSVDLYTEPGAEQTLLSAIAARLDGGYRLARGTGTGGRAAPLTGTVTGSTVEVSVRQLSAGRLVARARTGCSAGSAPAAAPAPTGEALTRLTGLLTDLGTAPAESFEHAVPCPRGGRISTVAVLSRPADAEDLVYRLAAGIPASARRFPSPSNHLAYRDGPVSVVVAASDDNTAVTAQYTRGC